MAREYLPLDMTVAQLREAIDYDHSTGKFYWRRRKKCSSPDQRPVCRNRSRLLLRTAWLRADRLGEQALPRASPRVVLRFWSVATI